MKGRIGDRHIKTPLNCEMEHSVKIDLTFTAYRSLPCAVPKFLDNCFIIGFTHFPVAIPTSSEECVISKRSWQLRLGREREKAKLFFQLPLCLGRLQPKVILAKRKYSAKTESARFHNWAAPVRIVSSILTHYGEKKFRDCSSAPRWLCVV